MEQLILIIIIFFKIIQVFTFIDVIVWRFWIEIKILRDTFQPWYDYIWKLIPSNLWPFNFSPFIIMMICEILINIILWYFPSLQYQLNNFLF